MPKNTSGSTPKPTQSVGPIFDKKHFKNKKLVTASVVAVAVAVVLLISLPKSNTPDKETNIDQNKAVSISTIVVKGDSKTAAARRAVSEYLATHAEVSLTAGQRLFMETNLRLALTAPLKVGETVEFKTETIASLITKAKELNQYVLPKWEALAKGVKF